MRFPSNIESAHLLFYLRDLGEGDKGEAIDETLRRKGYYAVGLSNGYLSTRIPKSNETLWLRNSWAKALGGKAKSYPRYHLVPTSVSVLEVEGILVVAVWIDVHIDSEVHVTDRSPEAQKNVEALLLKLQTKFRNRLISQRRRPPARNLKI